MNDKQIYSLKNVLRKNLLKIDYLYYLWKDETGKQDKSPFLYAIESEYTDVLLALEDLEINKCLVSQ